MNRLLLYSKEEWRDGPWKVEDDYVQLIEEISGYPCFIRRLYHSGAWCGGVGIPPKHALYMSDKTEYTFKYIDVHGNVSYSGWDTREDQWVFPPQHYWWIGFDCMKDTDLCPKFINDESYNDGKIIYRTEQYALDHAIFLAQQLMLMDSD